MPLAKTGRFKFGFAIGLKEAPHAQAPHSLVSCSSAPGGCRLGRSTVRAQRQQGAVSSGLLPLGAEDIAKERGLLQHPRGSDPGRTQAVQGMQAIKKTGPQGPVLLNITVHKTVHTPKYKPHKTSRYNRLRVL